MFSRMLGFTVVESRSFPTLEINARNSYVYHVYDIDDYRYHSSAGL